MSTRRARTGLAEDFVDLVAMLPWWGGVVLAVAFYALLHSVASTAMPATHSMSEMGNFIVQSAGVQLATIGQYLVPVLCLTSAMVSIMRRAKRRRLLADIAARAGTDALQGLTWQSFELLVGEYYRNKGYTVAENGGSGPDDGIDLTLRRRGETYLVQCKQWRAWKVGVEVVRELYGVMAAQQATGGVVVTSGRFTQPALDFAEGRNIELIDGQKLTSLIDSVNKVRAREVIRTTPRLEAPRCPTCNCGMVVRKARTGPTTGLPFWGCLAFPSCRGTRDVKTGHETGSV
ncbi:restriction endonuclease [soil metagenome]